MLPGAADRILSLTEEEAKHRHAVELKVLDIAAENQPGRRNSSVLGALLVLAIIGIAFTMVLVGYPWPATILILGKIAGLISVIVFGARTRPRDD